MIAAPARPTGVPRSVWFQVRRGDRRALMETTTAQGGVIQARISFGILRPTPRALAVWALRAHL